jgi:superfamily II DNA helicase RecQ
MPFQFFQISVHDNGSVSSELNAFLRTQRILSIDKQFVLDGSNSYWFFCIDFASNLSNGSDKNAKAGRTQRIDYREVLSEADFQIFASLRDWRKVVAQGESVPVYAVLTNQHLASIVQGRARTKSDLASIDGIGEAKIAKYGESLLNILAKHWTDETNLGTVVPDTGP